MNFDSTECAQHQGGKVRVEGGARSSLGIGACYEAVACRRETDDSVACNPDSRAGAQAAAVVDFTVCAPLVLQVWMR